uniref:olfactory receptor 52D1-like n=1 Tax=Centroberyx gerrardi TaxID=166262 RepID=UPI003AAADDC9
MENQTFNEHVLLLERLKVTPQSSFPAFIFLLIIYIFIVVSNLGLVVLISRDRSLHQPMYLLLCNLSINDVFGATAIVPRLLSEIFTARKGRYISYIECVIQAFCVHYYASCLYITLMIMGFDRYVAICNPLRYTTIMTNNMVLRLTVFNWGVSLVLVGTLIALSVRLSRCRRVISHPFCDNASLFKLSCESIVINNIYGLAMTMVVLALSIGSTIFTYLKIAMVCLNNKSKVLNSRALQTCATHLTVYMIMIVSGTVIIILHRFPQLSDQRKLAAIMFHVVPPAMNAVIYGLQIKEVRQKIIIMFHNNKVTLKEVKSQD